MAFKKSDVKNLRKKAKRIQRMLYALGIFWNVKIAFWSDLGVLEMRSVFWFVLSNDASKLKFTCKIKMKMEDKTSNTCV